MFSKLVMNFKKKSLSQRFLFVIGILFFLLYLVLGLIIFFWKSIPINMQPNYRMAFGVLLIVYSFFRFARFFNANS
jgi:cytochrome b subunit of formate dehydrogenase